MVDRFYSLWCGSVISVLLCGLFCAEIGFQSPPIIRLEWVKKTAKCSPFEIILPQSLFAHISLFIYDRPLRWLHFVDCLADNVEKSYLSSSASSFVGAQLWNISAVIFFRLVLNLAVLILQFMGSQDIMASRASDVNFKATTQRMVLHLPDETRIWW